MALDATTKNLAGSGLNGPPVTEDPGSIGQMLLRNAMQFQNAPVFGQRCGDQFEYVSWGRLLCDVLAVCHFLDQNRLAAGDRVALITSNSYDRLAFELAVLSSGRVAVPIFHGYDLGLLSQLVEFSDVRLLLCDDARKLAGVGNTIPNVKIVETGDECAGIYAAVVKDPKKLAATRQEIEEKIYRVVSRDLAMIMYTSGTSSFPKGVMLTHGNIMSQQSALAQLWRVRPGMRFLAYLPWHHSFGGLFERFFALASGGSLALDDSFGRNPDRLIENFRIVKPHVYFSVPKVYADIVSRIITDKSAREIFFHSELEFVFTAAAPLPSSISDVFRRADVPVVEGWGLTETSPCCTLTGFDLERSPGIVGHPIPGVSIRLGESDEIEVRGPNVMAGYFRNEEATRAALTSEGWFRTGDIGEITQQGLRILSRKDRVFKLNNGEKVFPTPIEESLRTRCRFIKHAFVFGSGQKTPLALLFPNQELLSAGAIDHKDEGDCSKPACTKSLADCLRGCMESVNMQQALRYARIGRALVIDRDLLLEKGELTPSFKLVPRQVEKNYAEHIDWLLEDRGRGLPPGSWLIDVEQV